MTKLFDPKWMNARRRRRIEKVLDYARAQIGKQYKFGAQGPDEFDCSGLVVAAYKQINIDLPHNSYQQSLVTRRVFRNFWHPRKGDLVFYYHPVGHVAIYVGKDAEGKRSIIQAGDPQLDIQKVHVDAYAKPVRWGRVRGV